MLSVDKEITLSRRVKWSQAFSGSPNFDGKVDKEITHSRRVRE